MIKLARDKGSNEGSVYYRKERKKWIAQYYDYDPVTEKRLHKEKSFNTEEQAKSFLKSIMYQKENPIYIENHGIPLMNLMRANLENKHKLNMISDSQYDRVDKTLKKLSESAVVEKNIDDITPEEIQRYLNTLSN